MIGLAGSIISPNKTAANQRADAFNFPRAGSVAEANSGNGHTAHYSNSLEENEVPATLNSRDGLSMICGPGPNIKGTAEDPGSVPNPGVIADERLWKRHTDPEM